MGIPQLNKQNEKVLIWKKMHSLFPLCISMASFHSSKSYRECNRTVWLWGERKLVYSQYIKLKPRIFLIFSRFLICLREFFKIMRLTSVREDVQVFTCDCGLTFPLVLCRSKVKDGVFVKSQSSHSSSFRLKRSTARENDPLPPFCNKHIYVAL